jgi:hypothetical protein
MAANGLMLVAGFGLMTGLRVPLRTPLAWLAAAGFAYVSGVAATLLMVTALLVMGVPFGIATLTLVAAAVAAAGFAIGIARQRREPPADAPPEPRRSLREAIASPTISGALVVVFVVLAGLVLAIGYDVARTEPLEPWDAWSIWTRKAEMLVYHDTISSDFWTGPAYGFMHQDYPLLMPLLEATHFRAGASIDTQAVHSQLWLLFAGFVWAAAWVASHVARPLIWAPVLLALVLAPGAYGQVLSGYADLPMALFLGLGVLLAGIWIEQRHPWQLWMGALMLGAAASVKNEGLFAALAALVCLSAVIAVSRDRPGLLRVAGAWAVFLAAILPWRIWMAVNDITGDIRISKGIDPGYILDRTDRLDPTLRALEGELMNQGQWLYLVPLGAAIAVAALIARTRRDAAAFYLATGLTVFAGLVWAYLVSTNEIGWHLATSANRVVAAVVLVCAVAILHLGGALARAPQDPGR